ncbi:hypothetical protein FB480_10840 [Agrobacterium vitis]|nr:hypothetical protein FB480_10840 [Agrobacterium vitis]
MEDDKVVTLNETRARQGKKGLRVLYILGASIFLVLVLWGVAELVA